LTIKTKNSAGFTLVELLISLALSLVVLTSVSNAFINQRKTYDAQEQMTELIQKTRAVMEIITREVKLAGFNPTNSTTLVGIPYSTTQLEIRADLDGDGTATVSDTNELIIYTHDGNNLEIDRDAGQAFSYAKLLAENIQSFTFDYLDSDGNATTTANDIRMIEITITARTAKPDPDYGQNSGYRTYTLSSTVSPPNLAIGN
jgi:type IV pilus assembly protein PilW